MHAIGRGGEALTGWPLQCIGKPACGHDNGDLVRGDAQLESTMAVGRQVKAGCVVQVETGGVAGLQPGMAIVTDKGKSSKEQGNLVVKEAVAAMMHKWQAPFRCAYSLTLGH